MEFYSAESQRNEYDKFIKKVEEQSREEAKKKGLEDIIRWKDAVSWRDVQGNPYNTKIHPNMIFSPIGLLKVLFVRLKGDRRMNLSNEPSPAQNVFFGRDYVTAYIANKVFEPLLKEDKEEQFNWEVLEPLLKEAYEFQCEKMNRLP